MRIEYDADENRCAADLTVLDVILVANTAIHCQLDRFAAPRTVVVDPI